MLKYLCEEKKVTLYRCAMDTQIPYSTLSDIALGHTNPQYISAFILQVLSSYFELSMDELYKILLLQERPAFEQFRSEMCHKLKRNGDIEMLRFIRKNNYIDLFWKLKWYPESLYLLALFDLLSKKNNVNLCEDYDWYRKQKMKELIVPVDVLLDEKMNPQSNYRETLIKNANREFLNYNILEGDVYE